MQITTTFKSCLTFTLPVLALSAGIFYLIVYNPPYAIYVGGGAMVVAFIFIFYVNIGPIVNSLAERASDINAVYTDVSGKGLHIFSEFTTSRIKSGLCPVCTEQYYFLAVDTRKLYYKDLFTYEMETASGHAGYVDYSSFEEDVLGGEDFKNAMADFSLKAGWPLELGAASREGEDESYATVMGDYTYKVVSSEGAIMTTLKICCFDMDGKLLWGKKI